jgi:hypothetical protein
LFRRPAGIAERQEKLPRAFAERDRFDQSSIRSHGDAVGSLDRAFQKDVVSVQQKALVITYRPAVMNGDFTLVPFNFRARSLEQIIDRALRDRLIDD